MVSRHCARGGSWSLGRSWGWTFCPDRKAGDSCWWFELAREDVQRPRELILCILPTRTADMGNIFPVHQGKHLSPACGQPLAVTAIGRESLLTNRYTDRDEAHPLSPKILALVPFLMGISTLASSPGSCCSRPGRLNPRELASQRQGERG